MKTRYYNFDHGKYWEEKVDLPSLQPGQLLVKTTKSLISVGTESACNKGAGNWYVGRHGYSNAGIVIESKGDLNGFKTGTRVFSLELHTDFFISEGEGLFPIPDEISDETVVFATLGRVALHAIERAKITVGQSVVIVGLGAVGLLSQQLARLAGANNIITVDINEKKLDISKALGSDCAMPPDKERLEAELQKSIKNSTAPVFIETSGSSKALKWILQDAACLGSTVVVTGTFSEEVSFDPFLIPAKELQIVGAMQPFCPSVPSMYYPYNTTFNTFYILEQMKKKNLKVNGICDGFITPEEVIPFYDSVLSKKPVLMQPIIDWTGH